MKNQQAHGDLTADQHRFWDENGFLILRGALNSEEVNLVNATVDRQWEAREKNQHVVDILSGPDQFKSFRMHEVETKHKAEVYKLNNLFYTHESIREVALNPVIAGALNSILNGEGLICNSLNFERGSQQPFHLDTWFMPPPVEDNMVAANIALEPMDPQNGPFIYYPGSHKIPYWAFSHGGTSYVDSELNNCLEYMNCELEKRGLTAETFACEAGDVFLWHARLFHGGSPILDRSRTRKSLVVHYWRKGDVDPAKVIEDKAGAHISQTLRGEFVPA